MMGEPTVWTGLMSTPAVSSATWWQCKQCNRYTEAPSGGVIVASFE